MNASAALVEQAGNWLNWRFCQRQRSGFWPVRTKNRTGSVALESQPTNREVPPHSICLELPNAASLGSVAGQHGRVSEEDVLGELTAVCHMTGWKRVELFYEIKSVILGLFFFLNGALVHCSVKQLSLTLGKEPIWNATMTETCDITWEWGKTRRVQLNIGVSGVVENGCWHSNNDRIGTTYPFLTRLRMFLPRQLFTHMTWGRKQWDMSC